jgi:hypothetical protein
MFGVLPRTVLRDQSSARNPKFILAITMRVYLEGTYVLLQGFYTLALSCCPSVRGYSCTAICDVPCCDILPTADD